MSDTFGPLAVPLPAPGVTDISGDPLLSTTLSFFQAVLNANAPAAWQAVYKDVPNSPVVRATFSDDPEQAESTFNDRDLPALFAWRSEAKPPVWLAEDWRTRESTIAVLWVMPGSDRVKRALRSSIINGIASTLDVIVERGRDPSWIVSGDPDPKAATAGSLFSQWGKFFEFAIAGWKPYAVKPKMLDSGTRLGPFLAVQIQCRVVEHLSVDLTRFDVGNGVDLTIKTPDGGVGDGGVTTGHQLTIP